MLKPPGSTHRRTHSDILDRAAKVNVSLSVEGHASDGQLGLDRTALSSPNIERKPEGGFVVRHQMKQVVGDLVSVLGELKTVVGDIRTLVTQIDVVTHKLDQSVSSDQSDRSFGSSNLLKPVARSRSRSSESGDQKDPKTCHSPSNDSELGRVVAKRVANMCDLSCFYSEKEEMKSQKSLNSHGSRSRSSGSNNTPCFVDRQGERLSNHDTVYVAYRQKPDRYSSDKRPLSTPNKMGNPLMGRDKDNFKENCPKPKRNQSKSNPYISHIYENIKAFTRRTTGDGYMKITQPCKVQDRSASIPKHTQKQGCITISSQHNSHTRSSKDTSKVLKPSNGKTKSKSPHKNKKKLPQDYSGLYEREMEEKLELEFDDSLDLLDTLAEIQTVDTDFDQGFEDGGDVAPVRDLYPIDMVRKHADVVAWAQSAWPGARHHGNSLDYSDDPCTEEETDSDWYEVPSVPKYVNPHLADFRWRTIIEP